MFKIIMSSLIVWKTLILNNLIISNSLSDSLIKDIIRERGLIKFKLKL